MSVDESNPSMSYCVLHQQYLVLKCSLWTALLVN